MYPVSSKIKGLSVCTWKWPHSCTWASPWRSSSVGLCFLHTPPPCSWLSTSHTLGLGPSPWNELKTYKKQMCCIMSCLLSLAAVLHVLSWGVSVHILFCFFPPSSSCHLRQWRCGQAQQSAHLILITTLIAPALKQCAGHTPLPDCLCLYATLSSRLPLLFVLLLVFFPPQFCFVSPVFVFSLALVASFSVRPFSIPAHSLWYSDFPFFGWFVCFHARLLPT